MSSGALSRLRCHTELPSGELLTIAVRGDQVQVCYRCHYIVEIEKLTVKLGRHDPFQDVITDGLRTVYEVVKQRSEEVIALLHAAESKGTGKSTGKAKGKAGGKTGGETGGKTESKGSC